MPLRRRKLNLPEASHAGEDAESKEAESGSDPSAHQGIDHPHRCPALGDMSFATSALVVFSDDLGSPLGDLMNPFPYLGMVLPQLPFSPSLSFAGSSAMTSYFICPSNGVLPSQMPSQRPVESAHPFLSSKVRSSIFDSLRLDELSKRYKALQGIFLVQALCDTVSPPRFF